MRQRPILQYYGGKWRLAPKIIERFPPHSVYVEPYGGGANVLIRKQRSKIEVYNDIYSEVVNFFKVLRDNSEDLIQHLLLTPYAKEEHSYCKTVDLSTVDEIERARIFFVRSWQDRRQVGLDGWTGWKRYKCGSRPVPEYRSMLYVAERLRNVLIESMPALDVIEKYDSPDTLFYIDPPYVVDGLGYVHGLSERDHVDLAAKLSGIQGYAIVSGRDSRMYDEIYDNWWKIMFVGKNMKNRGTSECLWMNYELV